MQTRLNLRYDGPLVDSGLMNVYQASSNMIAFSEFMVAASKTVFGDQIQATAEVAGFARGSFVTDLVFNFIGPAATIFSAFSSDQLLTVIKESIGLWKHLAGQPPKQVQEVNHQEIKVTNNSGQIIQVQTHSLHLVFNEKASGAVQSSIRDALQQEGIDGVEISSGEATLAGAKRSEAYCFVPVLASEEVTDSTIKMVLTIEAPVFKDGNKWRLHDGQNSFHADILDREFLAKVDGGESFAKGDLLTVELRITQEQAGMKITTARAVTKVHEHRRGPQQRSLLE